MDFHASVTSGTHWTIREEIVEVGRRREQYCSICLSGFARLAWQGCFQGVFLAPFCAVKI